MKKVRQQLDVAPEELGQMSAESGAQVLAPRPPDVASPQGPADRPERPFERP
jgi:hypothetical protein